MENLVRARFRKRRVIAHSFDPLISELKKYHVLRSLARREILAKGKKLIFPFEKFKGDSRRDATLDDTKGNISFLR